MSSGADGRDRAPTARMRSLARRIAWSYEWRRVLGWLALDLILVAVVVGIFVAQSIQSLSAPATDGLDLSILPPRGWSVVSGASGRLDLLGTTLVITGGDQRTYTFALVDYLQTLSPLLPLGVVLLAWELLSMLRVFSETRRVRRMMQPLNDLAMRAEVLGSSAVADPMASDGDKIATLEAAIASASVDAPTVSTGDTELASIEVALNGLLRRMQEAKLQQMRFVNDASHELRTPIAVIQGYVNMLDRWGKDDPQVLTESIEALKAESEHMQELVEQLLFLARGDSGRNTLTRTPLDMAAIVAEVTDESAMIDSSHAYACTIDGEAGAHGGLGFEGDLALVKQSLRIIVQNAQKYSPEGSTIVLAASADADAVYCSVTDEGIGMSEADAAHVFDRFYRAESARDKAGSGLGLSIADWIVSAHGGSIEVLSYEGVGTRFTLRFPR